MHQSQPLTLPIGQTLQTQAFLRKLQRAVRHVNADNLREVAWPEEAIPAGTYSSIAELTAGSKRIVLASIARNEPILRTKITGPGQKATLSAVIQDGSA